MKSTRNFNQTVKVTIASVTFLFAALMPIQATSGENNSSEMNELQAASSNLSMFNNELEKAAAFNAPAFSENSGAFEVFVAESKLTDLFSSAAKETRYEAPAVYEDLDVAVALENLDQLNSQVELSVRYTAE